MPIYFWSASLICGQQQRYGDSCGIVSVKRAVKDDESLLELIDAINKYLKQEFPKPHLGDYVEVNCLYSINRLDSST